jgi:hypothetical protein
MPTTNQTDLSTSWKSTKPKWPLIMIFVMGPNCERRSRRLSSLSSDWSRLLTYLTAHSVRVKTETNYSKPALTKTRE